MAKVIRIITYEGSEDLLRQQMEWSLADGHCDFISSVDINIQTIHADVESDKFGSGREFERIDIKKPFIVWKPGDRLKTLDNGPMWQVYKIDGESLHCEDLDGNKAIFEASKAWRVTGS